MQSADSKFKPLRRKSKPLKIMSCKLKIHAEPKKLHQELIHLNFDVKRFVWAERLFINLLHGLMWAWQRFRLFPLGKHVYPAETGPTFPPSGSVNCFSIRILRIKNEQEKT